KGIDFKLFDYEIDKIRRFFIESSVKCNYDFFKSVVNTFIIQYGLISGELMRGKAMVLLSEDKEFNHIKQYCSLKLGESKRGFEAIRPRDMIHIYPQLKNREDRYLSPIILENLITLALDDEK